MGNLWANLCTCPAGVAVLAFTEITSPREVTAAVNEHSAIPHPGPMRGLRILELGSFIAGPFATHSSTSPSNTYPTADGKWAVIGANNDAMFQRLFKAIGREDLAADPRYADNPRRLKARDVLDQAVAEWTGSRSLAEITEAMDAVDIPVGPIYTAAEIVNDAQYKAREMIVEQEVPGIGPVKYPGIVPKLSGTPGEVRSSGPAVGEHNEEIYSGLLGLNDEEIEALRQQGII